MIQKTMFCFFLGTAFLSIKLSGQDSLQSLKQTYASWIEAWNKEDAATIADLSWMGYGFGRDVPFIRQGAKTRQSYEEGINEYLEMMDTIGYREYFTDYRIIQSTGFINGYYEQTTKQKNGVLRTVYGRQSLVLLMINKRWHIVHYHRSQLPNEFIR